MPDEHHERHFNERHFICPAVGHRNDYWIWQYDPDLTQYQGHPLPHNWHIIPTYGKPQLHDPPKG